MPRRKKIRFRIKKIWLAWYVCVLF